MISRISSAVSLCVLKDGAVRDTTRDISVEPPPHPLTQLGDVIGAPVVELLHFVIGKVLLAGH
jgi:hypothetical protein